MARRTASLAKFKSLLDVDPDSLESILPRTRVEADEEPGVALAPDEWERLTQILKHGLDRLAEPDLQLLAIEHVGEIYEHQLLDRDRAFRWWGQVLAGYPCVQQACDELERLARSSGDWRLLVQVYSTALNRLSDASRRHVQHRLARTHLEELGEVDRAERLYQGLWQKEQDRLALDALQGLYDRTGRKGELTWILRQRIKMAETVEERTELLLRLGFLHEVELGEPNQAIESYREVLQHDRLNRQALQALEQIYMQREQWLDLLPIYDSLASASTGQETATYVARMARICDDMVNDRVRSRQLWQRVRELRPDDRTLLEEMAQRFESMERWEELAEVIGRQAALESGPAQAQLFERQGRVYGDRLGDRTRAMECWRKVLELDPERVTALLALSDLYGRSEAWSELVLALRRLVSIGERDGRDSAFMIPLHASVARLEEQVLDQVDRAVDTWRRVLGLDPANGRALDELERLLAGEARWSECLEVIERKIELCGDAAEQVPLLLRQADVFRCSLLEAEGAIRTFRRVLALSPGNESAHDGLCSMYREQGSWEALTEQVFAWLESVTDTALAVRLLQEAATVFEDQLAQPEKAFLVWQSALKQDPENGVTTSNLERLAGTLHRWEELLQAYDAVVQATASARIKVGLLVAMGRCRGLELGQLDQAVALLYEALHMDPETIAALEALEEIYRRSCRWPELVSVVRRHAELVRDTEQLVPLLCALGELQCRVGAADQALATYRKVLDLAPARLEALLALEALYLAFGAWGELVEVLQLQFALGAVVERQLAIHLQIGEIFDEQLGDATRAIAAYQEALALDADNRQALKALEHLYEQSGQSEEYLDMLERQLNLSDEPMERVAMYERVAGAWEEQFERRDRAMACLDKLLAVDGRHEGAYVALERLCQETGDLRRLADVLRRHADAADGDARVELLLRLGSLRADTLRELELAVEVYQEALALDPREPRALEALANLHEKLVQWKHAANVLARLAARLEEPDRKAATLYRLGRITEDELHDVTEAEERYTQAIAVDGSHFESMLRLVEIYRGRAEWPAAAAMMVQAEPHTANQAKKAQLLYEAGMIHLEWLADAAGARELLARTLELDPDHMKAGEPLSQLYEREGRLAELEPVLDMLARKVDARDKQSRLDVCFRLGRTAASLGKIDKAIRFYLEARGIDFNHLPTLRALAELQFRTQDWAEAFKTYQSILVKHRPTLSKEEVADLFFRLGGLKVEQGEQRKALGYYDKALEEMPLHRGSLEALIEIQTRLANWEAVVRAKTAMIAVVEVEERFKLLQECGDLHRERLGNMMVAVEAYHAAVALKPDDRPLLTKFLELLSEARRWAEALQIVLRLTELEPAPEVRARFFYTAAAICRDELGQPDQALQLFGQALDCAADQLKAFEAIDRLCTARKDWPALAQAYQRMIARLGEAGEAHLRGMLWHNLGEVYRTRLRQIPEAIEAFEAAAWLEPQNMERHKILAELYELADPPRASEAIGEHRKLIACDPQRYESMSALAALYGALGQQDSRACVCGALTLLGRASADELKLYQQHRRAPRRARGQISDELWLRCVRHPAQDARLDALLAAAAPALIALTARPSKEFGLKRRHRASSGDPATSLFHHATSVLGLPVADLYAKSDQAAPLMVANTVGGPTVVLGAPLLGAADERQLSFAMGQQLAYLRPGYFLCRLFPSPSQLRLVLLATIKLVVPSLALGAADAVEVGKLGEQLAMALSQPGLPQQLAALAQPFCEPWGVGEPEGRTGALCAPGGVAREGANGRARAPASDRLDLVPWWNGVSLTANRAGFILCDDLQVAAQAVQLEPSPFGTMSSSDKARELIAYSISLEYLELRRQLGLGG